MLNIQLTYLESFGIQTALVLFLFGLFCIGIVRLGTEYKRYKELEQIYKKAKKNNFTS